MKKHGKLLRYIAIALCSVALSVGFTAAGCDTFYEADFNELLRKTKLHSIKYYFDKRFRTESPKKKEAARRWLEGKMYETMHPACMIIWFEMLFKGGQCNPQDPKKREMVTYLACLTMSRVVEDGTIMGKVQEAMQVCKKLCHYLLHRFRITPDELKVQLAEVRKNLEIFEKNGNSFSSPKWIRLFQVKNKRRFGRRSIHLGFLNGYLWPPGGYLRPCSLPHKERKIIRKKVREVMLGDAGTIMQEFGIV